MTSVRKYIKEKFPTSSEGVISQDVDIALFLDDKIAFIEEKIIASRKPPAGQTMAVKNLANFLSLSGYFKGYYLMYFKSNAFCTDFRFVDTFDGVKMLPQVAILGSSIENKIRDPNFNDGKWYEVLTGIYAKEHRYQASVNNRQQYDTRKFLYENEPESAIKMHLNSSNALFQVGIVIINYFTGKMAFLLDNDKDQDSNLIGKLKKMFYDASFEQESSKNKVVNPISNVPLKFIGAFSSNVINDRLVVEEENRNILAEMII